MATMGAQDAADKKKEFRASGSASLFAFGRAALGALFLWWILAGLDGVLGEGEVGLLAIPAFLWTGMWLWRGARWVSGPVYVIQGSELRICGLFRDATYDLDRFHAVGEARLGSSLYLTLDAEDGAGERIEGERYTIGVPMRALEASDARALRGELQSRSRVSTRSFEATTSALGRQGLIAGALGVGALAASVGTPAVVGIADAFLPEIAVPFVSLAGFAVVVILGVSMLRALWVLGLRARHPVYSLQGEELVVHGLLWNRRWSLEAFSTVQYDEERRELRIGLLERVAAARKRGAGPVGIVQPIPGKRPRRELTLPLGEVPESRAKRLVEVLRDGVDRAQPDERQ